VINIIVINPILISRVIRRIYVDTFYSSAVLRKQGFKGKEVIPFYDEVVTGRIIRLYTFNS
jgi:hypothetical protein